VQGDSWTVAFHDAEDAVAFSLQVGQPRKDFVILLMIAHAASFVFQQLQQHSKQQLLEHRGLLHTQAVPLA
jgi:membrane-bound metal-dependent hydrolase YbcI (DUF457 family)